MEDPGYAKIQETAAAGDVKIDKKFLRMRYSENTENSPIRIIAESRKNEIDEAAEMSTIIGRNSDSKGTALLSGRSDDVPSCTLL